MYYYSLNDYCKKTFHTKCYKIALNAHMSCPNRDGSLGVSGCIFCSRGGSGDFAVSIGEDAVSEGLSMFGDKQVGDHYIAYLQAYTNTYAPLPYLEKVYRQALSQPGIIGLSIATRPDCIDGEIISLIVKLRREYQKFIWIELGLQTIHENTARYIRRGYPTSVFDDCMALLQKADIPAIVHLILGLPGETAEDVYASVAHVNKLNPFGIKLQLLHILKDTDLAAEYAAGRVHPLTKEEYLELLIGCIERLRPDTVIHRLTGDGPKEQLIAPLWSLNKKDVLNSLHKELKARNSFQGKLWKEGQTW